MDSKYFIVSVLIAIAAFVYSYILSLPGELFGKMNKFLYKFFKNDDRECNGLPLHPIYKLIIGCEKCIAGQMALWGFFIWHYYDYCFGFIIFKHLLFVDLTIFITVVIKGIYKRYIE